MNRLSASSHPVSNTRRHGNRDDDETPQEAKQATAARRRTRPQIDEKSERAIARERHGNDDKQANRSVARSRKSTSAHASHDPEGGGTSRSKQTEKSRGEGAGRKEKEDERHGEHEHLSISSPALPTSSKHRITHQPPLHQRNQHVVPSPSRRHRITKQSAAPVVSHQRRSRPRRHLITSEAAGRRGTKRGTTDKSWPWHHIQSTPRQRPTTQA